MAAKRCTIKVTANFEANLGAIESFLTEADARQVFTALLDDLAASIIPNLERYPELGRPFLDQPAHSVEAREKIERVRSKIGSATLREYLAGDFLILYAVDGRTVYLLSIKHHRQLSFNLPSHWR
ncbi:MAG: hypothetical protein A3F74_01385 [Betaproteobacteria bacterium RIFCSPLOWO2_12_FULL_62_58]|nr:MAG: hypothetical protein A3F74_01385 [Betaproteobacteria bacterium RIFCSPLOWO2_12_FULL_62_58]